MSNEDVDELLKGVDTKDGNVNYSGMDLLQNASSQH